MKTRQGFVSNSSSSSFIIKKKDLTVEQYIAIKNHIEVAQKEFPDMDADQGDAWNITETETTVEGDTWMNNFDMHDFMTKIGIENPPDCSGD
jgi:hypothetical protein